jgi:hypothetical protein
MQLQLRNKDGFIKTAPQGFSFTTLFFGFLVPLVRGDFKWCAIMFFVDAITFGLAMFIFPFFYNSVYTKELQENGYRVR